MTRIKNIIVTGSAGMVGSALKNIVHKEQSNNQLFNTNTNWIWLTRTDVDLEDYNSVYNYIKNYDCKNTIIINLAANVGGLFKNIENNIDMFESNIKINLNILQVSRKLKISKVVNILSTCIFPNNVEYPLTEEQINNGEPHNSNIGYSYSKRIGQIYSKLINDSEPKYYNYVNLIPTNLYGYKDNYNIQDAHVIPAIIHKCVKLVKTKNKCNKLILPGDGKAERMFLYDKDFAKIILDIAYFKETSGDYIVSGSISDSLTINNLANIIADKVSKQTNYKIEIEFEKTSNSNGQNKKPCSNKKLVNLYKKYNEDIPIKDGKFKKRIDSIIKWFWDNYDNYPRK